MNYNQYNYIKFENKYLKEIVTLWNNEVVSSSFYTSFNEEEFLGKVIYNKYFKDEGFILAIKDDELIAYGCAVVTNQDDKTPGYIAFIVVKKEFQRKGIGSFILRKLEDFLLSNNKTFIRQMFLNPINLKWIIPNTNNHTHANAPGVAYNTPWYFFLMNNGFNVKGPNQDVYHLDIDKYEHSQEIVTRLNDLASKGYLITDYDQNKHYGFSDLFKALNNQDWQNKVDENLAKKKPDPMIVVVKDNRIVGWTGPLLTTFDKRGSFAGIGIHPNENNLGLGRLLFSELVYRSKLNNATYMTLFTGSENVARYIYLKTGFKIVETFAILVKDLSKK